MTETTVGDFCPFIYGRHLSSGDRRQGPVPVYGSNGIIGWHDHALTNGPTVIIGRKGTVGQVSYSPVSCWPIDTTFYVEASVERDVRFVYFLLSALGLETMNSDSAVPGLNRDAAHSRSILVPRVAEQRAIAHILGALDDKIDLNRRMNETLEAMTRALFKSWFVDFDPVRAKVEGRDPGLPADVAALFPDSLQDSGLGEIPQGWSVGSVDDEFELTMGQSPPGETYNEMGVGLPFYQGRADFGVRFPTRRVYCTTPTRFASTGDTLVSVRAPVGDVNMATERCAIGRGVAAVRHKTGSRSFTYQFMGSIDDVFAQFDAEGTVFGSIGKKDFHAIPCVRPPHKVVLEFERRLSPVDSRIEVNERESCTLGALRDTLLPKLLSGEVHVKDVECVEDVSS